MTLIRMFRHRAFALLWFAGLISLTGDWLLRVALPIYVYQLTGSPATTSAVVAIDVGAAILLSPLSGVLVDRWDRRRVMLTVNLLQAVLVLPLVAVQSAQGVWIVLAVTAAQSALRQFIGPAEHALLPMLVQTTDLPAANSLNALNNNIARLVGPALGGVVAATIGLAGAAVLDSASFVVAAVLVGLIRGAYRAVPEQAVAPLTVADLAGTKLAVPESGRLPALRRWRAELGDGLRTVRGSVVLRALFVVVAVTSVGEGIMASLLAVFVSRGLGGGAPEIAWLMSAQAVGGVVGGVASTMVAGRIRPVALATYGLVIFGVVDLAIFNYPRLSAALAPEVIMFIIVGVPGALFLAALMTLLQTEVADGHRGRVFATAMTVEAGAALVGSAIAAGLTDRFGVINVLTAQGAAYVFAGLAFWLLVRPAALDNLIPAAPFAPDTHRIVSRGPAADSWYGTANAKSVTPSSSVARTSTCEAYRSWQRLEFRPISRPRLSAQSSTAMSALRGLK